MSILAFSANFSKTKTISATSTTSSVTLDATDVQQSTSATGTSGSTVNHGVTGGHGVMRIVNAGPNTAFLRWGIGTQTALATDMPILAGITEVFSKTYADDTVAAICASGQTATVYVTCGEGL